MTVWPNRDYGSDLWRLRGVKVATQYQLYLVFQELQLRRDISPVRNQYLSRRMQVNLTKGTSLLTSMMKILEAEED